MVTKMDWQYVISFNMLNIKSSSTTLPSLHLGVTFISQYFLSLFHAWFCVSPPYSSEIQWTNFVKVWILVEDTLAINMVSGYSVMAGGKPLYKTSRTMVTARAQNSACLYIENIPIGKNAT